jgi:hypothetical protein
VAARAFALGDTWLVITQTPRSGVKSYQMGTVIVPPPSASGTATLSTPTWRSARNCSRAARAITVLMRPTLGH